MANTTNDLLLWAKFINATTEEEFEELAKQNEYIASAYEQLKKVSQDEQKRKEYETRKAELLEYQQNLSEEEK